MIKLADSAIEKLPENSPNHSMCHSGESSTHIWATTIDAYKLLLMSKPPPSHEVGQSESMPLVTPLTRLQSYSSNQRTFIVVIKSNHGTYKSPKINTDQTKTKNPMYIVM
jgi:hypothetical protein